MPASARHTHHTAVRRFYGFEEDVFEVTVHEPVLSHRPVPEAFVQDLWKRQCLNTSALCTTDGQPIQVVNPGTLNTDTGPDFSGVHLRIGATTWRGDVEVHTISGDWFAHGHHEDPRYNRVVLHVSLYPDVWTGGLLRADGTVAPECILAPALTDPLRDLLFRFHTRRSDALLCAPRWSNVPAHIRADHIHSCARERFEEKRDRLGEHFLRAPDIPSLLHEELFAALGYSKNAEPMRQLAQRLPRDLILQVSNFLDLEALHFGVAGLLPAPEDLLEADRTTSDYVMDLRDRFAVWQQRLQLSVMPSTAWQFFRLRPANFPTLRIAQAVRLLGPGGLLHHDPVGQLLKVLGDNSPLSSLENLLHTPEPGPFWRTHFRLKTSTRPRSPGIGTKRVHAMIINAIVPVLLLHAEQTSNPALETQLWSLLEDIPPENDQIVRLYKALGSSPENAYMTQGLHQLYRSRCEKGRCLSCPIGQAVLQGPEST